MASTTAPGREAQPAWTVSVSSANLRLLEACVRWLLRAQRDPALQQRLADLRSELLRAEPINGSTRPWRGARR
jgi:hypothetical protein